MNRQDRDRYDYGRYDGYSNDEHYHSARNLTDEFEQDFRRDKGYTDHDLGRYRPQHSYHEGNDIEATMHRRRREDDSFRNRSDYSRNDRDRDRNQNYYSNPSRGNYNQDTYGRNTGRYRSDQDRYQQQSDRPIRSYNNPGQHNDYGNSFNARNRREQDYNSGSREDYRNYSRPNDRNYSGGTSYSGPYRPTEDYEYSRNRDRNRDDRWYNEERRRRDDY